MSELNGINLAMQTPMHADGSIDYKMGFDDPGEEDIRFKSEGVDIVMEPEYVPLLDTATLDFVALEPGEFQFIFLNPKDSAYRPPEPD